MSQSTVSSDDQFVSIIMPNHNDERFLEDAINCVLNQSLDNWELIIVDNASNDNSQDIAKKYERKDSRIKTVFLDVPYKNPAPVRNEGIKKAQGRFLAFLDSDDIWAPDKLAKQMAFMMNKDAAVCTTHIQVIDENNHFMGEYTPDLPQAGWKEMLQECYVSTSATMIDREKISNIEFPSYKYCQDYACWMKLIKSGHLVHILPEKLAQYRINPRFYILKKVRKIFFRWRIHRECLDRTFSETLRDFLFYAYTGVRKSIELKKRS